MSNALVSIIVPVFNSEKWLCTCVDSILVQTYSNIEVLLIDDGSTDNSYQIIESYLSIDRRVRAFHIKNGGPSRARNYGLQNARGTYIQFVDSDDVIHPNMTEMLVESLEKSNTDLVMCGYEIICNFDEFVFSNELKGDPTIITREQALKNIISTHGYRGFPVNKLYKKKIILEGKLEFDNTIYVCEDLLFLSGYLDRIEVVSIIGDKLYGYIQHENSLANSMNIKKLTSLDALRKLIIIYGRNGLTEANSLYVYTVANFMTYKHEEIIKERFEYLLKELRYHRKEYCFRDNGVKENLLFIGVVIAPHLFCTIVSKLRKLKEK